MKNNEIPNLAITASSDYHGGAHETQLACLNNVRNGHMGSWQADLNKAGQWLQINFEEETGDKTQHTGKAFLVPSAMGNVIQNLSSSDSDKWEEYKENDVVKVCDGGFLPRGQV